MAIKRGLQITPIGITPWEYQRIGPYKYEETLASNIKDSFTRYGKIIVLIGMGL